MGFFFLLYSTIACLMMIVLITVPLKMCFRRERPTRVKSVYRYCNMRDRERGSRSMPSGDANAAAFLTAMYGWLYGNPVPAIICIPMVSLGRVYVHCHWIGDTIIGSFLGLLISYYCYSPHYFGIISMPLFRAVFPHV